MLKNCMIHMILNDWDIVILSSVYCRSLVSALRSLLSLLEVWMFVKDWGILTNPLAWTKGRDQRLEDRRKAQRLNIEITLGHSPSFKIYCKGMVGYRLSKILRTRSVSDLRAFLILIEFIDWVSLTLKYEPWSTAATEPLCRCCLSLDMLWSSYSQRVSCDLLQ